MNINQKLINIFAANAYHCISNRLLNDLESLVREARLQAIEECANACDDYAARNAEGENNTDERMSWISTYHKIAGMSLAEDLRRLAGETK